MTLTVVFSDQIERLAQQLSYSLNAESRVRGIVAPKSVVTPNPDIARWLETRIAESYGIAANIDFLRLESFLTKWLIGSYDRKVLGRRELERRIFHLLLDDEWLTQEVPTVARYIGDRTVNETLRSKRIAQLTSRLAILFENYTLTRPALLSAWLRGETSTLVPADDRSTEEWQSILYRRATQTPEPATSLYHSIPHDGEAPTTSIETPLHVFGFGFLAPTYMQALSRLGQDNEVTLYAQTPCLEYWEDIFDDESAPLPLRKWARPQREFATLASELTQGNVEILTSSEGPPASLLGALQGSLRQRERTPISPQPHDRSIRFLGAPSVRREVEIAVEELRTALDLDESLRLMDCSIQVSAAQSEVYLPLLRTLLREANLPFQEVGVSLRERSAHTEAALSLIDLLGSNLKRPDVVRLLCNPAFRSPISPDIPAWKRFIDASGAFHGLEASDFDQTYLEGTLGVHWHQAVNRIFAGALCRPDEDGRAPHFPVGTQADDQSQALGLALASLIKDSHFAKTHRLTGTQWSTFFLNAFTSYLSPESDPSAFRALRELARGLGARDLSDRTHSYELFSELLRGDILHAASTQSDYLAKGVALGPMQALRSIPFRRIHVVAMGEGDFPRGERNDTLDLRRHRRQSGDVNETELDLSLLLDVVLSAQESLSLSWVERDEASSEELPMSQALLDLRTELLTLGEPAKVESFPMHSKDEIRPRRALIAARDERFSSTFGESLRASLTRNISDTEIRNALHDNGMHALADRLSLPEESAAMPKLELSSIRKESLYRFLVSPVTGWAEAVLGIRAEPPTRWRLEDEPFQSSAADHLRTLRMAFELGLRRKQKPVAVYQSELVPFAQASGLWPLGPLAERQLALDEQILNGWARILVGRVSRTGMSPHRVRFGPAGERDTSDTVLPSIVHDDFRLVGDTELLLEEKRASLFLEMPYDNKDAKRMNDTRHLRGLRAFLDYVLLVLAQGSDSDGHRAVILHGGSSPNDATMVFGPLAYAEAHGWMSGLLKELVGLTHEYYLPAEALIRDGGCNRTSDAALRLRIEAFRREERDRGEQFGSDKGSVRNAIELPTPDHPLELYRRRFGLFFRLLSP